MKSVFLFAAGLTLIILGLACSLPFGMLFGLICMAVALEGHI